MHNTSLFRFPPPQFWNRYKRGSDAHCKWPSFLEFDSSQNRNLTDRNVKILDKSRNLSLIIEIGQEYANFSKHAAFSRHSNGQKNYIQESSNNDKPPNFRPRVSNHSEFILWLRLTFTEIHQPCLVHWQNNKQLSASLAFHIKARN